MNFGDTSMNYDRQSNKYYDVIVSDIIKNSLFTSSYDAFIRNKNKTNYIILTSFIEFRLKIITNSLTSNTNNINNRVSNAFILYDDNLTPIFYSYLNSLNKNTFENYSQQNIVRDNNFSIFKTIYVNGSLRAVTLSNPNVSTTQIDTSTSSISFKRTMYLGYWMDYNSFNSIIDLCKTNGVTHIILEFIILRGNLSTLEYFDTINCWKNFSYNERQTLLNKIRDNGMQLMASFGGATSFTDGFQLILDSPTYSNPSTLATDLVNFCYDYNIPAIDLDIEHYPTTSVYPDTSNLVEYVGILSQQIKLKSSEKFGYYILLSHAPQTPYFNNDTWGYVYSQIEQKYGSYIDFYNIQYYNQSSNSNDIYINYVQIFKDDPYYNASVRELMNAQSINVKYANIPSYKIVIGKATKEETYSGGYVPLFSSDASITNTMSRYVESTKYESGQENADIIEWNSQGGIMCWVYKAEQGNNYSYNIEILNYFNYVKTYA